MEAHNINRTYTEQELREEREYRRWERVGLLIGDGKLTLSADFIAQQEADEAIRKLREQNL